ncbi:PaaI family thioesterase [Acrocarpospora catenulata]|uniref:PaaI family thioesterase n=1 Tax=Acrocarpospora catenulata TaxID=2836182 RepID=UPI001BDAE3B1|nr:PaaI family thioesterase [Acrocarpospora catenulata]
MSASEVPGVREHFNLWLGRRQPPGTEDPAFTRMADAVRGLQDKFTASRPPPALAARSADTIEELVAALARYQVGEPDQVAGRQFAAVARGQTFVPPLEIDAFDGDSVTARVSFGRFYLGSNGAVHGGAISLVFDDLLGQVANAPGKPRARTASLSVDYRRVVPIETELIVTAHTSRIEGRKVFVGGALRSDSEILAEAMGLFVRLLAHQQ